MPQPDTTTPDAVTTEEDRFFLEIVLCLGGIFAVHGCDDALVRTITRSLGHLYDRARARRHPPRPVTTTSQSVPVAPRHHHGRLQRDDRPGTGGSPRGLMPHPAVEALLFRIGR